MADEPPGTGRGTSDANGGGGGQAALRLGRAPSTCRLNKPNGPPPRAGEDFSRNAARLAGFAGAYLGWAPEAFWRATPAELGAVVVALRGEDDAPPPDAATIARLQEAFPDG